MCKHTQEIKLFLRSQNLDVLLVSETHVTDKSHIHLPNYAVYHTPHPDKAHGGTAVIVRRNLKHHSGTAYSTEHIQATSIVLEDMGEITITAVYSAPNTT